jgi:dTDP-4-amino-4,6-dideoxygalactose transaminase
MPSTEDLVPYLQRIDQSKIYSNFGPLVRELEVRLAKHFGVSEDRIATASSGTMALVGAMVTAPVDQKSKWIIPSWTFTATPAAAVLAGVTFRFADVDRDWRVQVPPDVENLVDVLPFGDAAQFDRIPQSAKCVVVDAAASIDAIENIELPTTTPCGVVVSLHATKPISAGEGGAFISNDLNWVKRFQKWTNFGMWGSRESTSLGCNAKLSEYAGAVGLASLDLWPETRERWMLAKANALDRCKRYGLESAPAMVGQHVAPYWQVECPNPAHTSDLEQDFASAKIQTRRWWSVGCHAMPAYGNVPCDPLIKTRQLAMSTIGLPLYPALSDSEWSRIDEALEANKARDREERDLPAS